MTKVEEYLHYKQLRDNLPTQNERVKLKWARSDYESLSFKIAMLKPTERDWQEHTFTILKR